MICSGGLLWFFHGKSRKLPLGWRGKIIGIFFSVEIDF